MKKSGRWIFEKGLIAHDSRKRTAVAGGNMIIADREGIPASSFSGAEPEYCFFEREDF